LKVKLSSPTTGMVEVLEAGVVEAHVVRGPAGAERLAPCRELADEV
jgi:hypothetical protein